MAGRAKKRSKRLFDVIGRNQYRLASSTKLGDSIYSGFNSIRKAIANRVKSWGLQNRVRTTTRRIIKFVDRRPLVSFFSILGILIILIILGSLLSRPQEEAKHQQTPKEIRTYSIGESPRVSFQAQIEKTGVIKIVAQAGGIVQYINVTEGQFVEKGTILVGLSSNYQGGNAASLQASLAATQLENAKNTFDLQKDIIARQRQIAEKSDINQDDLRKITENSIESTQNLLNLNDEIITSLNEQKRMLEATNVNGSNNQALLSLKQLLSQVQGGTNQLRVSLQTAQYTVNPTNAPAQLPDLQKDLALKQLDLQEKTLSLSLETARIQYQIALVNQASFFPSAPFSGVVERVYVVPGESLTPGSELLTLHGKQTSKAVLKVPDYVARNISKLETSKMSINNKVLEIAPYYISTEATDGQLYSVFFALPQDYQNSLTNNEFVTIELPVGNPDTTASVPYVPIDAIYQTQDQSYVFVNSKGEVLAKTIELGEVLGEFVEVEKGLLPRDQIILDRTVVAGDKVKVAI